MSFKNDQSINFKVVQLTMVNGSHHKGMAMEFNCGPMEQNILANGKIIKLMEQANLFIPMAISMKVNGKMIKLMVLVFLKEILGLFMRDFGRMINNMVKEKKRVKMVPTMKEATATVRNVEKVNTVGILA